LADKKASWKVRQDLRAGELAAISKATFILHNDDSRDLFKKSLKSQGFLFLQTERSQTASGAAAALREAARRSGDKSLLVLAKMVADPSVKTKFGPVIAAIDKMIAILKGNEKTDLDIKQTCESDRMEDTKKAVDAGRAIDDMTDTMTRLSGEIKNLEAEIATLAAEHQKVKDELASATQIREDENAAFKVSDADDKAAAETVASASAVLEGFYRDNKLVLAQNVKQPAVEAGEAPPPPPATWDGAYGGKTGESQGIVAILDMVHKDLVKDRATAQSEEDASLKEYQGFKKDSNTEMKALNDEKNKKEGVKGRKENQLQSTRRSRSTKKGDLDAVLEKMQKINPNCEYFEVNYPLRLKNRQIELDGLEKAKAILNGGTFNAGPDPNREITPGDAAAANFLQRK